MPISFRRTIGIIFLGCWSLSTARSSRQTCRSPNPTNPHFSMPAAVFWHRSRRQWYEGSAYLEDIQFQVEQHGLRLGRQAALCEEADHLAMLLRVAWSAQGFVRRPAVPAMELPKKKGVIHAEGQGEQGSTEAYVSLLERPGVRLSSDLTFRYRQCPGRTAQRGTGLVATAAPVRSRGQPRRRTPRTDNSGSPKT